jgi:hypothetical protein
MFRPNELQAPSNKSNLPSVRQHKIVKPPSINPRRQQEHR